MIHFINTNEKLNIMKLIILAQYFTVTMVLTITVGLFTLKPGVKQYSTEITAKVVNVAVIP